ncbi:MAG TPA: ATP-binding cassette domain-containing protein [Xanthobacteraceae bacterium]|nr:ATP-binding cassette domain-containing protein [Xanthobacteraceae bacterium]
MTNSAMIDIAGVTKSYRQTSRRQDSRRQDSRGQNARDQRASDTDASFAIQGINLRVPEGTFIAIVGGSGSGKTTLLKTVNRLIDVDAGRVSVGGEEVAHIDPVGLRRRIGYVFQGIGLFPHMTVAENIAITPRLLGWAKDDIAARVRELLDLVALPQTYAPRFPSALSGGEQQRVGVARALAAKPKLVLMDEPFGALDPVTRDALGAAYRDIHARLGLTTLMVTHDIQEALLLADRIVIMQKGRILAQGTPQELLADDQPDGVRALMDMPRRQAARIADLSHAGPAAPRNRSGPGDGIGERDG